MKITINGKIPMVRRYFPSNKISNIIYMVNYNLALNILTIKKCECVPAGLGVL